MHFFKHHRGHHEGRTDEGRGRFFAMDGEGRGGFGGRFGGRGGHHGGPFGGFGGGRFGGDRDGPGFGGPGGFDDDAPRRRGKRFDGEGLRLLVLALLAETPQHGYQLIRAFAERSNDAYQPSPGVLYPLLAMLTDEGLLAEAEESTGNRRAFRITEAGATELAANADKVAALFERLAALGGGEEGRPDVAPVRRAMHGLRSAVIDRVGKTARTPAAEGDAVRDMVLEIARLIDEVTQKVERL